MVIIKNFTSKMESLKNSKLWLFVTAHPELFTIIGLLIAFYYISLEIEMLFYQLLYC